MSYCVASMACGGAQHVPTGSTIAGVQALTKTCNTRVDVTVLGLVGGAPGGETPRVADSSAAGAGRFLHNSKTCNTELA